MFISLIITTYIATKDKEEFIIRINKTFDEIKEIHDQIENSIPVSLEFSLIVYFLYENFDSFVKAHPQINPKIMEWVMSLFLLHKENGKINYEDIRRLDKINVKRPVVVKKL